MNFSKILSGFLFLLLLTSCGQDSTSTQPAASTSEIENNGAIAEKKERKMTTEKAQNPSQTGTYCYGFTNNNVSLWSLVDIDKDQQVKGELHLSNYSAAASYSAYAKRQFTGSVDDNKLRLTITTTIEADTSTEQATWSFSPETLITADETLDSIDCKKYPDALVFFEKNPPTDLMSQAKEEKTNKTSKESNTKESNTEEVNNCESSESVFLMAETKNFWVNICGGDLPHSYVGVSKKARERIRLDLSDYDNGGDYFEAKNGDYTYMVIFGTAKGSFLTVTQGDKTIMQEPLTSW